MKTLVNDFAPADRERARQLNSLAYVLGQHESGHDWASDEDAFEGLLAISQCRELLAELKAELDARLPARLSRDSRATAMRLAQRQN